MELNQNLDQPQPQQVLKVEDVLNTLLQFQLQINQIKVNLNSVTSFLNEQYGNLFLLHNRDFAAAATVSDGLELDDPITDDVPELILPHSSYSDTSHTFPNLVNFDDHGNETRNDSYEDDNSVHVQESATLYGSGDDEFWMCSSESRRSNDPLGVNQSIIIVGQGYYDELLDTELTSEDDVDVDYEDIQPLDNNSNITNATVNNTYSLEQNLIGITRDHIIKVEDPLANLPNIVIGCTIAAEEHEAPNSAPATKPVRKPTAVTTKGLKPNTTQKYKCDWPACNRKFMHGQSVERHKVIHTGEQPYTCHICKRGFADRSVCLRHVRNHAKLPKPNQKDLIKHKRKIHRHGSEKSVPSEDVRLVDNCGTTNLALTCEQIPLTKAHTGENSLPVSSAVDFKQKKRKKRQSYKPKTTRPNYKCDYPACGKRFEHLASIIRHKIIHTGEKPYECDQCGRRFADKSNHVRHKKFHQNEVSCNWNGCGRRFKSKRKLSIHSKSHGSEETWTLMF